MTNKNVFYETAKQLVEPTINFMYFTQNYSIGWIEKVWQDNPSLIEHFKEKFSYCYGKYGASASVIRFFFELDDSNKVKLLNWVDKNYSYKS